MRNIVVREQVFVVAIVESSQKQDITETCTRSSRATFYRNFNSVHFVAGVITLQSWKLFWHQVPRKLTTETVNLCNLARLVHWTLGSAWRNSELILTGKLFITVYSLSIDIDW